MVEARVSESVVSQAGSLAEAFDAASPFRHVVIDGFFAAPFAHALEAAFPGFDDALAVNEDGVGGGKSVHERLVGLGPAWEALDELVRSDSFRDLIGTVSGIPELVFDPWYFGGGTHENRHGQDLDPHVDFNYHPITRQHRRLNLIVYFERDWKAEWGGALDLHRDPRKPPEDDEIVRVPVEFNRAVLFETTERSWHGFERIDLPGDQRHRSRRSFALYFYSDDRPKAQTALPHSTIYIDRHLPGHLRAGHTLTEQDMARLHELVGRRDQHLARLYRHVSELTARLESSDTWLTTEALADLSRSELETRAAIAERDLVLARARIAELLGSTSWKVTAPLRAVRRLFQDHGES